MGWKKTGIKKIETKKVEVKSYLYWEVPGSDEDMPSNYKSRPYPVVKRKKAPDSE